MVDSITKWTIKFPLYPTQWNIILLLNLIQCVIVDCCRWQLLKHLRRHTDAVAWKQSEGITIRIWLIPFSSVAPFSRGKINMNVFALRSCVFNKQTSWSECCQMAQQQNNIRKLDWMSLPHILMLATEEMMWPVFRKLQICQLDYCTCTLN